MATNCTFSGWYTFTEKILREIPLRKGDIVLIVNTQRGLGSLKVDECMLKDVYNNPKRESWFANGVPLHINRAGAKSISEYI